MSDKKFVGITAGYIRNLQNTLESPDIIGTLTRGAFWALVVRILGATIGYVSQILLARWMGVDNFGVYTYVFTWISLLMLPSKMGMDTSAIRFVARYNARYEWGMMRGFLERSIQFPLIASIIISALTFAFVRMFFTKFNPNFAFALSVGTMLLPVYTLLSIRQGVLQALRQVVFVQVPQTILIPFLLALVIWGVFYTTNGSVSEVSVLVLQIIVTTVAFFVSELWLRRSLPKEVLKVKAVYHTSEWVRASLSMMLFSGMLIILGQIDILLVGTLMGTKSAGIYGAATRTATLMLFGLNAVSLIIAPMISELYSVGRYKDLQRMITFGAQITFGISILFAACIIITSPMIMNMFGAEFIAGRTTLIILAGGQLVNALAGPVGLLMTMTNHQIKAIKITFVAIVANVFLNVILIPVFGLEGAAIATASTNILWNVLLVIRVHQILGIHSTIFVWQKG